jgi:hypothetical protein
MSKPVPDAPFPPGFRILDESTSRDKTLARGFQLPDSGFYTWRPLVMPVQASLEEEKISAPKDKGKGKAKAEPDAMGMEINVNADAQADAPVSVTPAKRKRGRPRADTQPAIPITDILG